MSISKAFRKLPSELRDEAKERMKEFVDQDGMTKEAAAKEAISMMIDEADGERADLMSQMKGAV